MRWLILLSLVSLSLLLLVGESEGWWSRRRRTSSSPPPSSRRRYSYSPPPSTKRRRSYYTRRRRSSSSGCGYLYCYNGGIKYCASGWWSSKKVAKCRCPSRTTGRQCERYKCPSKTCHNGGTKYCQKGIAYCRCKQGYFGTGCRNGCGTKTCYNGGKKYCGSWRRNFAKCRCPLGWGKHDCGTAVCPRLGCKNKGTKYCSKGNAYCKCQPGFYGRKCEKGCPPKSCKNGGTKTCHNGGLFWRNRVAKCRCLNGYAGPLCGKVVCPHLACSNGGTKYCSKPGVASCRCRPDFDGPKCKKGCKYRRCDNGGTKSCVKHLIFFTVPKCFCKLGYYGKHCEKKSTIKTCGPRKCKNGGIKICVKRLFFFTVPKCLCKRGYYGKHCDKKCPKFYCKHGKVHCTNHIGIFTVSHCVCRQGFKEKHCDVPIQTPTPTGPAKTTMKPKKNKCLKVGSKGVWFFKLAQCKILLLKPKLFIMTCVPYALSLCACYEQIRQQIVNDHSARVQFFLIKRQNIYTPIDEKTNLKRKGYDSSRKTAVIIHGFRESATKQWIKDMAKALLNESMNVITVQWESQMPRSFYCMAVARTQNVGEKVARLVKFLNKQPKNSLDKFHLIGFSLGAHVAGYAGREIRRVLNAKIGRITGLDPAGPKFQSVSNDHRLDSSDAKFVDVIHTDSGYFFNLKKSKFLEWGTTARSGHLDFWPNGGSKQRGCVLGILCDHAQATKYFIESIISANNRQQSFKSYPCESWEKFKSVKCTTCNPCPEMGYNAIKYKDLSSGDFYLYTNKQKKYSVQKYGYITLSHIKKSDHFKIRIYGSNGTTEEMEIVTSHKTPSATEKHTIPIKTELGSLKSIAVWKTSNVNSYGGNFLHFGKITFQLFNKSQRYTACYKKKMHMKLKKGSSC